VLATKFGMALSGDTGEPRGSRAYLRRAVDGSLERLRTDRIDLIQLHSLAHPDEWERALAPGGALEACIEAREQGLVRFIGVTGHGWTIAAMHRRSLQRFAFDAVLLPWNWYCAHHASYAADFEALMALCAEREVAVQTIKSLARGPWAAGVPRRHATWYQPLENEEDIRLAVHWVLARPHVFLNSVGDVALLPKVLHAAAALGVGQPKVPEEVMASLGQRAGLASIFGL
jgi:aryl-alcohol dehydrogenase-like predicted oxidoreductase